MHPLHLLLAGVTMVSLCLQADAASRQLAGYRVRRHYALKKDKNAKKLSRLKDILDLDEGVSLREDDSLDTAQGTTVKRFVEVFKGKVIKGSRVDVSVKPNGDIDRFGGYVTTGLEKEAEALGDKCDGNKDTTILISAIRSNGYVFPKRCPNDKKGQSDPNCKRVVTVEYEYGMAGSDTVMLAVVEVRYFDNATRTFSRTIYDVNICTLKVIDSMEDLASLFGKRTHYDKKSNPAPTVISNMPHASSFNKLERLLRIRNQAQHATASKKQGSSGEICKTKVKGFGGNTKIGTIPYGPEPDEFCLGPMTVDGDTCYLNNSFVKLVDLANGTDDKMFKVANFSCDTFYDDSVNGAFSVALDAFFYATKVASMYRQWYSYSPLTSPKPKVLIHFSSKLDNAYWDGRNIILGDGGNETFPYAVLDTIAHELGHGVTERSSGLVYTKQSGAINEAFSDMSGEVAEMFVFGKNDWVVGRELLKEEGKAIRYFDDPSKDGKSIANVADYKRKMDVHHASGIFNKVFYLVAQQLGVRRAFEAFLVANRVYWGPRTKFRGAACDVVKGAYDSGLDLDIYIQSFESVGVNMKKCSFAEEFVLPIYTDDVRPNLRLSRVTQPVFQINVPEGVIGFEASVQGGTNTVITIEDYPSRFSGQIIDQSLPGQNFTFFPDNYAEGKEGALEYNHNEFNEIVVYLRLQSEDAKDQKATLNVVFIDTVGLLERVLAGSLR